MDDWLGCGVLLRLLHNGNYSFASRCAVKRHAIGRQGPRICFIHAQVMISRPTGTCCCEALMLAICPSPVGATVGPLHAAIVCPTAAGSMYGVPLQAADSAGKRSTGVQRSTHLYFSLGRLYEVG